MADEIPAIGALPPRHSRESGDPGAERSAGNPGPRPARG
jgi:hypothetical protein